MLHAFAHELGLVGHRSLTVLADGTPVFQHTPTIFLVALVISVTMSIAIFVALRKEATR